MKLNNIFLYFIVNCIKNLNSIHDYAHFAGFFEAKEDVNPC